MDCVWDSLSAKEVGVGRLQIRLFFLCTSPCSSDTRLCGLPPRGMRVSLMFTPGQKDVQRRGARRDHQRE